MEGRLLFVFLLVISSILADQFSLGDRCELDAGGWGICKRAGNCPSVQEMASRAQMPQVCFYDRNMPVVCCPVVNARTSPSPPWSASDDTWNVQCGDSCVLETGGLGSCRALKNCPRVAASAAKGGRVQTCFLDRERPVVCCPRDPPHRPHQQSPLPEMGPLPPAAPSSKTTLRPEQNPNGKSWKKCQEYSSEVYQEVPLPTLPAIPERVADCAQVAVPSGVAAVRCRPKEFPHMAALGYGADPDIVWLCGGSLISDRFVLTTAGCLRSSSRGAVRWVALGDLNMASTQDKSRPQTVAVAETLAHPEYVATSLYHDVALLRLAASVAFDAFVRPACLHTLPATPPGQDAVVTGWGVRAGAEDLWVDHLKKIRLRYVSTADCNDTYKPLFSTSLLARGITEDTMFCAGDPQSIRDTCVKDSGGPLQSVLLEPYCMYSVVGLASFGTQTCAEAGVPAVFTRVSHYVPWIEGIVWPTLESEGEEEDKLFYP